MSERDDRENRRTLSKNADLLMAARDDSTRYCLKSPVSEGYMSVPATNVKVAQQLAASEYPQTDPEDWELLSDKEARSIFND